MITDLLTQASMLLGEIRLLADLRPGRLSDQDRETLRRLQHELARIRRHISPFSPDML